MPFSSYSIHCDHWISRFFVSYLGSEGVITFLYVIHCIHLLEHFLVRNGHKSTNLWRPWLDLRASLAFLPISFSLPYTQRCRPPKATQRFVSPSFVLPLSSGDPLLFSSAQPACELGGLTWHKNWNSVRDRTENMWQSHTVSLDKAECVLEFVASPTNHSLACATSKVCLRTLVNNKMAIKILDPTSSQVKETLTGHEGRVSGVCWQVGNDNVLFSSSHDKTVRMWDLRENKKNVKTFSLGALWNSPLIFRQTFRAVLCRV